MSVLSVFPFVLSASVALLHPTRAAAIEIIKNVFFIFLKVCITMLRPIILPIAAVIYWGQPYLLYVSLHPFV